MGKPSKSRFAILGLLASESMTGYDIKKFTEDILSHFWRESFGSIYPLLKKLSEEKLIKKRRETQDGKPDRIIYSITTAGKKEFADWIGEPCDDEFIRSELLLKMFFASGEPPELTKGHLSAFLEKQKAELAQLNGAAAALQNHPPDKKQAGFWLMTIRRGQLVAKARIQWAEECLRELRK